MTITLDAPLASLVPNPRLSEEDALLAWASGLSYGIRGYALALSDMPKSYAARKAALGWEAVKGKGVLPNRDAALLIAQWARQGVERHPDGELGLWRADFLSRWTSRARDMDARTYSKLCKPFGGVNRVNGGQGESYTFFMLHPESRTVDHRPYELRLALPAAVFHDDMYGPQYFDAKEVLWQEPLEDLTGLADSIDGMELVFWDGAYELRLYGSLVTVEQYRNFHRFL